MKIMSQIPPIITIAQNNFGFSKHQPIILLSIQIITPHSHSIVDGGLLEIS